MFYFFFQYVLNEKGYELESDVQIDDMEMQNCLDGKDLSIVRIQ